MLALRLPELGLGLKPMLGFIVLPASVLFPEGIGAMRDVIVGRFAVRAVGQEPWRGGLFWFAAFIFLFPYGLVGLELRWA